MGVFSDPHCRYLGTNCISGFNQIGGHEIQCVCSHIFTRYLGTNCGSGFNQIGGHEIQWVCSHILTEGI